jgi:hypothetical protein
MLVREDDRRDALLPEGFIPPVSRSYPKLRHESLRLSVLRTQV